SGDPLAEEPELAGRVGRGDAREVEARLEGEGLGAGGEGRGTRRQDGATTRPVYRPGRGALQESRVPQAGAALHSPARREGLMPEVRVRKRDPYRCVACEASYELAYFDDREDERAALPAALVDVACPRCGRTKSVSLPSGADRTLEVEIDEGEDADEGAGG